MSESPLSPTPLPPFGRRGAIAADGARSVPLPTAGEGKPARSDGRERGRTKLLRDRAKAMRSGQTDAEHRLWQILRAKRLAGYKFKRQLPINHYIADFVCLRHRLIVEADGGQHAEDDRDERRDAYLRSQGFRVLRFWNIEIFDNEEGVLTSILEALEQPLSPTRRSAADRPPDGPTGPPPQRGEGFSGASDG